MLNVVNKITHLNFKVISWITKIFKLKIHVNLNYNWNKSLHFVIVIKNKRYLTDYHHLYVRLINNNIQIKSKIIILIMLLINCKIRWIWVLGSLNKMGLFKMGILKIWRNMQVAIVMEGEVCRIMWLQVGKIMLSKTRAISVPKTRQTAEEATPQTTTKANSKY